MSAAHAVGFKEIDMAHMTQATKNASPVVSTFIPIRYTVKVLPKLAPLFQGKDSGDRNLAGALLRRDYVSMPWGHKLLSARTFFFVFALRYIVFISIPYLGCWKAVGGDFGCKVINNPVLFGGRVSMGQSPC